MKDLTILCGVEACAIFQNSFPEQPTIWPSVGEANRIIEKFRSLPEFERVKRMINQETFTEQRLKKMEAMLKTQQKDNRHKEFTQVIIQRLDGSSAILPLKTDDDCVELDNVINQFIKDIDRKMEILQNEGSSSNPAPQVS
ncbi:agamous-like MADS-box protein AGL80 [Impatiens glandulifera]|uniref:agamous-like MADS-box protein AGL80 n=1 Tax=Impatiens glandulifera TaxID=253017 RepID=UPI001FB122D9|nr:agamous-like MADS-box protein AGL80 [Impatiens glandulifera]